MHGEVICAHVRGSHVRAVTPRTQESFPRKERAQRKRDHSTENDYPAKRGPPTRLSMLKSFLALLLLCSVNKLASVIGCVEYLGILLLLYYDDY